MLNTNVALSGTEHCKVEIKCYNTKIGWQFIAVASTICCNSKTLSSKTVAMDQESDSVEGRVLCPQEGTQKVGSHDTAIKDAYRWTMLAGEYGSQPSSANGRNIVNSKEVQLNLKRAGKKKTVMQLPLSWEQQIFTWWVASVPSHKDTLFAFDKDGPREPKWWLCGKYKQELAMTYGL